MNNQLARRALLKTSPTFARKHITGLLNEWFADIATRPDAYRATFEQVSAEERIVLNRIVDLCIQIAAEQVDIHHPPETLEREFVNLCHGRREYLWPMINLYFVVGSERSTEFLIAGRAIKADLETNSHE